MQSLSDFQINLWGIVLAYATLQGFSLAGCLYLHRRGSQPANRLLASLVFVIALQLGVATCYIAGFFNFFPHLLHLTTPLWFLIGPLLFFYVKALAGRAFTLRVREIGHALPMALCTVGLLAFYSLPAEAKVVAFNSSYDNQPHVKLLLFWFLYSTLFLGYVVASMRQLCKSKLRFSRRSPNTHHLRPGWLHTIIGVFALYVFFSLMTVSVMAIWQNYVPLLDYTSLLVLAAFVQTVAFTTLRQPEKLFPAVDRNLSTPIRLSESRIADIEKKLTGMMKSQKPFLNSELKIADLASQLAVPAHDLSQLLNRKLNMNFCEFVNQYRLDEAKRRLLNPAYDHWSILGIALDVGFNSKASFNRIFKTRVGQTPSQFRKLSSADSQGQGPDQPLF